VESLTAEINKIENQRFGSKPASPKKSDLSVTQILDSQNSESSKVPIKSKSDISVTQILNSDKEVPFEPEEQSPNVVKPVQIKRFVPKKSGKKIDKKQRKKLATKDIEKFDIAPPPPVNTITSELPKLDEVEAEQAGESLNPPKAAKEPVVQQPIDFTSDIILTEKPSKPSYVTPEENSENSIDELTAEEKERLQKRREEELLEKELALEDPDDLIDGINPYDVKEIEVPEDVSLVYEDDEITSVKLTRDLINEPDSADTVDFADTLETPQTSETPDVSIANLGVPVVHDIMSDVEKIVETDEVKKYIPSFEEATLDEIPRKSKKKKKKSVDFDNFKHERSNSALLESLNDSLAKKRESDINARRTLNVDTLSSISQKVGESYKGKTIPEKLNIDYKKQIIEDTGMFTTSNLHTKQIEARELGKKKKRKLREFILEDIEEDDYDVPPDSDESDEYDGYDSSGQIWQDLDISHKGLTWRFVLLFLITAGLSVFTFIHDAWSGSGKPLHEHPIPLVAEWFSSPSGYASALVYANLIAGVIGMCLCSGVIVRGLKHLFTGKADCDSACAVPALLTTLTAFAHIAFNGSTSLFEQGKAHVYVVVALFALTLNTFGKILMIVRAKKNFRFISGDSTKYSAVMPNAQEDTGARDFTKGIVHDMPAPVFLRKSEFLTDYLKNSYCTDWADLICRKLVPISAVLAILMGVAAYFLPLEDKEMAGNITWAVTAGGAFISALSSFMVMLIVNLPLLKAAISLSKSECVVMGYAAAQKFSKANAVVVDAGVLFPAGSVKFLNVKRCQKPNAIDAISIDESIIIAASLAIKANSIMSSMFYDMISGDSDLLYKIENPIYEVNMGITGWMGSKRVMLGNRDQMKHHGVDVPAENKERRHRPDNADVVYLAVGSETVAMFFIEVVPNPAVRSSLWELEANGIALSVKTKDSLVTVAKLADIFEIDCEKIRILSFDQHTTFDDYSRYTSRGSSEIACNGTFTSFTRALVTAKNLIRDMMVTSAVMFVSVFVAGVLGMMFVIFSATGMLSVSAIVIYNSVWLLIMLILQGLRRY